MKKNKITAIVHEDVKSEKNGTVNISFWIVRDDDQTIRIRTEEPTEKKGKCKLCPFINVHQVWE